MVRGRGRGRRGRGRGWGRGHALLRELIKVVSPNAVRASAVCLKSLSVSGRYRILVKSGGYVWAETHSAVIPSVRQSRSRPGSQQLLCILCVTYVLR